MKLNRNRPYKVRYNNSTQSFVCILNIFHKERVLIFYFVVKERKPRSQCDRDYDYFHFFDKPGIVFVSYDVKWHLSLK